MVYAQLPPKKRGDTWLFSFTWESLGSTVNLESCTARMQLRLRSDPEVVAEADYITIVPETGSVNVRFNAEITENLPIQLTVIPDQTLPL